MTSAKAMLTLLGVALLLFGCQMNSRRGDADLEAPYAKRQVWAVAPLANESGRLQVNGARVADHLTRQLEQADGLDVVAVNRVLAAMESLDMSAVRKPADAVKLRQALGVDALVVGTVTAYDPYDPPKLGLAVELYTGRDRPRARLDIRELTRAGTDQTVQPPPAVDPTKPVSVVSGFYDAADPDVRRKLKRYGSQRGAEAPAEGDLLQRIRGEEDPENWRLYRLSMDLYTEFVSHVVSERLLAAERSRLQPRATTATHPAS